MPRKNLDVTASMDTLEVHLAPAWEESSRSIVRLFLFLFYIAGTLGLAWVVVMLGFGWVTGWLEQQSTLLVIPIVLALFCFDMVMVMVMVRTPCNLVDRWASEWRPSLTLTSRTVQLGQKEPFPSARCTPGRWNRHRSPSMLIERTSP